MKKNSKIVGRDPECQIMESALKSGAAELITVYGRRRVGKTFLVREYFSPRVSLFL